MSSAQPADLQWLLVVVVMCINCIVAADLASLSFQLASFHCSLDRQMGVIFCRVCPTPIRLSRLTFDHDVAPVKLLPARALADPSLRSKKWMRAKAL